MDIERLITTFCHAVFEETGSDISLARAKTMVGLASLTWPGWHLEVAPEVTSRGRIVWRSATLDGLNIGGAFRRDPVGDNAPIIIDNIDPEQLVMLEEMRQCAVFIPLFGRQRLDRFDHTLAELFARRAGNLPLPPAGSDGSRDFSCGKEYGLLREWLERHGAIAADGTWRLGGAAA